MSDDKAVTFLHGWYCCTGYSGLPWGCCKIR